MGILKRSAAILLVLIMILALSGCDVGEADPIVDGKVLNIGSEFYLFPSGSERMTVGAFNAADTKELEKYILINVRVDELTNLKHDKLMALMDNGATLYIEGGEMLKTETVLGVPDLDFVSLSGAHVRGKFVFKVGGGYAVGLLGQAKCNGSDYEYEPTEMEPISVYSNDIMITSTVSEDFDETFVLSVDFVKAIDQFRADYEARADEISTMPNYYFFDLTDKDSHYEVGSLYMAQYRNDTQVMNNKGYTDATAVFTVAPIGEYVEKYTVAMSANYDNMSIEDQSSPELEDQTVQTDFTKQNTKMWSAEPNSKENYAAWSLETTVRVGNDNVDTYKSAVTSAFVGGNIVSGGDGIVYKIPRIEVSTAWRF